MNPPIHYDILMGVNPLWRVVIAQALRGDHDSLMAELAAIRSLSPAGVVVLETSFKYAQCGQQVFCVGPRLQKMFNETNINSVPAEFLKLPYECFFISLPQCSWELYGGPLTLMHRCGGMYVMQRGPSKLTLVLWGMENSRSQVAGDDATFWLNLDLTKAPSETKEDGQVYLDVEAFIKGVLIQANNKSDPTLEIDGDRLAETFQDLLPLFRVVFNLILYVNSLKAEKVRDSTFQDRKKRKRETLERKLKKIKDKGKKKKKRKKGEEDLLKLSEARVIWIGKSIEDSPPPPRSESKTAGTWQHRRGHWHTYWVGPRKNAAGQPRTDEQGNRVFGDRTVLKWVAPAHRDMASIVASRSRHYKFREEKEDWENGTG